MISTYELVFSDTFNKQLDKLDNSVKQYLPRVFEKIKQNPLGAKSFGHGYFRIRFLNFRLLYHVDENQKRITVLDVDGRKHIYDKYK